jgi:hypothetical protein
MAFTANIGEIKSSLTSSIATTYDYLRPNAFRFSIKDLPRTSFTCQSANLPDMQLGFAVQTTPFVDIPTIGDKINFGEFTIRFLVAEDMSNYLELYRWILALGFPKDYNQFRAFTEQDQVDFRLLLKQTANKKFWHTRMVL